MRLWEFKPNFATPASSTYTEITTAAAPVPVAAFDPITPTGRADVPQPPPRISVDTIADRLMHRLQYRNFGTHESLVAAAHRRRLRQSGRRDLPRRRALVRIPPQRRFGQPVVRVRPGHPRPGRWPEPQPLDAERGAGPPGQPRDRLQFGERDCAAGLPVDPLRRQAGHRPGGRRTGPGRGGRHPGHALAEQQRQPMGRLFVDQRRPGR